MTNCLPRCIVSIAATCETRRYMKPSPISTNAVPVPNSTRGLARYEQHLKWFALALGVLSTVAIVQDWYPWTMFISLPFCLIWIYCAWLRTERQLKYINVVFSALYLYGIARYLLLE